MPHNEQSLDKCYKISRCKNMKQMFTYHKSIKRYCQLIVLSLECKIDIIKCLADFLRNWWK